MTKSATLTLRSGMKLKNTMDYSSSMHIAQASDSDDVDLRAQLLCHLSEGVRNIEDDEIKSAWKA